MGGASDTPEIVVPACCRVSESPAPPPYPLKTAGHVPLQTPALARLRHPVACNHQGQKSDQVTDGRPTTWSEQARSGRKTSHGVEGKGVGVAKGGLEGVKVGGRRK